MRNEKILFNSFVFMISFLRIDVPNVSLRELADNRIDSRNRRQHAVIHIIITVLTIAPDAVEILNFIERAAQFGNIFVGVEVSGVSLRDFYLSACADALSIIPIEASS